MISTILVAAPLAAKVEDPGLANAWDQAKTVLEGTVGTGFLNVMAGIGILLILFGVFKHFWDKRRGNGGDTKKMWFAIGAGALLAAPGILMGFLLTLVDWALMGIMKVADYFTSKVSFK